MNDFKLFELIQCLSEKQKSMIRHDLSLPHMDQQVHLHLFNALNQQSAAGDDKINRKKIYSEVFAEQKYSDQKLRLLCSQCLKKVEHSLALKALEEDENLINLSLLKVYKKLNSKGLYEKQLNKTFKHFSKAQIRNSDFHDQKIHLEDERSDYLLAQKRNQDLNIQTVLNQVDLAYILKKLKFACSALAHQSIYSIEYDMGLLDLALTKQIFEQYKETPAIDLYYRCYQMLCHPEDSNKFDIYLAALRKHNACFPIEEIRSIYLFGLNVCIRRLNAGEKKYGMIGLEIYEEALKNRYLLINGKLSRYSYRNITMMAIRSGEFLWAKNFTEEYKGYLKKQEMKPAYHFNKALIHYYQNELEEARGNIVEADFSDHLIHLAAKTLQAKIYFQLQEDSLLWSHLDTMEMYIIRKKIIGHHRSNYKNFISLLRKMSKINPYNKDAKLKLIKQVKKENVLTERTWFLEELEK